MLSLPTPTAPDNDILTGALPSHLRVSKEKSLCAGGRLAGSEAFVVVAVTPRRGLVRERGAAIRTLLLYANGTRTCRREGHIHFNSILGESDGRGRAWCIGRYMATTRG